MALEGQIAAADATPKTKQDTFGPLIGPDVELLHVPGSRTEELEKLLSAYALLKQCDDYGCIEPHEFDEFVSMLGLDAYVRRAEQLHHKIRVQRKRARAARARRKR